MLPGKTYSPEEVLRILRKRAWLLLVPWAVIAAATAVVARKLPDTYRAQALIQLVPPRVPGTIVQNSTTTKFQDRLQAAQQTMLTRVRLESLIVENNLYEKERRSGAIMQDLVDQLKSEIQVEPSKGESFYVSFTGRDRRQVQIVTEKLASFFIDESLKDGTRRAEAQSDFVEGALQEALRKLREVEDRVKKYTAQYALEMPEQLASNQQAVTSTQQQLGLIISSIDSDTNTRLALERRLADLEANSDPAPATAAPAAGAETTAAQRLEALQRGLTNLKARGYSDTHPDVKQLMSAIASAKKEAEAEALRSPVATGGAVSPAEQARRRRVTDLNEELDVVKKRIAQKQQEEKRLREALIAYQARVDRAPARHADMLEMTREYEVLKKNHDSLVNSREQTSMSVKLQTSANGEMFNLLEPARLPERPSSPNRPLINVFGIIGGLAVGLGLVGLLEYRDQSFRTDTELGGYVSLPVLAVVPLMRSGKEEKKAFRHRVLLNAGCGSAVLVCVALLTYTFVR
jgi:polysaccharide chain length determinant protein (PEP-CTERM system associated)